MNKRWFAIAPLIFVFFIIVQGCDSSSVKKDIETLARQGRLLEALKLCNEEIAGFSSYQKKHSKLVPLAQDLRSRITGKTLSEAKQAYGLSPSLLTVSNALAILQRNSAYDDVAGRLKKQQNTYKRIQTGLITKRDQSLRQARAKVGASAWSEAFSSLQVAMRLDPENKDLPQVKAKFLKQRTQDYSMRMNKAVASGNWRQAQALADQVQREIPAMAVTLVKSLSQSVATLKGRVVLKNVRTLMAKSKYYTAWRTLKDARMKTAESLAFSKKISKQGTPYYLAAGQKALDAKLPGSAYLSALKAMEMTPDSAKAFELHKRSADAVEMIVRVQIAVSGFEAPAKEPMAGSQLSDALIAYLIRSLPYGIEVLERSKIDMVLKERGTQLKEISQKLGVKYFIIGSVSNLDVEHQKSEADTPVIVKIGSKTVPNPAYSQFVQRYGTNSALWSKRPPSATIQEAVTQVIKYKTGYEKIRALMTASVRIFDADKGAISFARELKTQEQAADDFHVAVAAANIKRDLLELPTDNEMKEKLRTQMVAKLGKVVLDLFQYRQWRFLEKVRYHLKRREKAEAIEYLAQGYLYCVRDSSRVKKDDKWFVEIKNKGLLELTE